MYYCSQIITDISRLLVIVTRNLLATVQYIKIYLYDITRAYHACILLYSIHFSLQKQYPYGSIRAYPHRVYNMVCLYH